MRKKKILIIATTIILILGIGIVGIAFSKGVFMSDESKNNAISDALNKKDYNKAKSLTDKYYSDNANHDAIIDSIELCKKYNVGNISIAQQKKAEEEKQQKIEKQQQEYKEFCSKVSITNMESKQRNSGNYFDACITVENKNSTPISYIEFNINMYDTNGNLINTAMTNESNIQGNSKRIVTKMLPCGEGTWKAEITKITQG